MPYAHIPRKALLRLALLGVAVVPWVLGAESAEGKPPAGDGVPSGTVAYFSGGACPAGWSAAANVRGRLVVSVTDPALAGAQVGAPLGDAEDRAHDHGYSGTVQLSSKNLAAADGSNQSGAQSGAVAVKGATALQSSGLPFVQVQPCVKP